LLIEKKFAGEAFPLVIIFFQKIMLTLRSSALPSRCDGGQAGSLRYVVFPDGKNAVENAEHIWRFRSGAVAPRAIGGDEDTRGLSGVAAPGYSLGEAVVGGIPQNGVEMAVPSETATVSGVLLCSR